MILDLKWDFTIIFPLIISYPIYDSYDIVLSIINLFRLVGPGGCTSTLPSRAPSTCRLYQDPPIPSASLGNPLSFERLTRIIRQIRARKKESLLLVQGQGGPGAVDGCIDWSSLAKRSVLSGPDLE